MHADGGVQDRQQAVADLLAELGSVDHVEAVSDPFEDPAGISQDGTTLVAHLRLDVENPVDMPREDSEQMLEIADDASSAGFQVGLGGQSIVQAEQGEIGSEGLGLAAAAIILLIMFGSLVAAGLPILMAVAGLAVSSTLTTVVISFVDAPDWSTSLATMMGIGIGIDYALLMVTRFREWRAAGLDPEAATVATLDTAGRSVMVAGTTVVISMLGLFAMGLSFMRGAAVVTIIGVLIVMLASVTLFPALLGYLGKHVDRLRLPLGRGHTGRRRRRRSRRALARLAGLEPLGRAPPRSWPRSSGSPPCWRSRCRSSTSASGSPTPATTARRPAAGRPTTCWPRASAPA